MRLLFAGVVALATGFAFAAGFRSHEGEPTAEYEFEWVSTLLPEDGAVDVLRSGASSHSLVSSQSSGTIKVLSTGLREDGRFEVVGEAIYQAVARVSIAANEKGLVFSESGVGFRVILAGNGERTSCEFTPIEGHNFRSGSGLLGTLDLLSVAIADAHDVATEMGEVVRGEADDSFVRSHLRRPIGDRIVDFHVDWVEDSDTDQIRSCFSKRSSRIPIDGVVFESSHLLVIRAK